VPWGASPRSHASLINEFLEAFQIAYAGRILLLLRALLFAASAAPRLRKIPTGSMGAQFNALLMMGRFILHRALDGNDEDKQK
jgi:hypothetical protein